MMYFIFVSVCVPIELCIFVTSGEIKSQLKVKQTESRTTLEGRHNLIPLSTHARKKCDCICRNKIPS